MRDISIATCFNYDIPIERQLPMVKKAGFNYVSIGGNYEHSGILREDGAVKLKVLLEGNGLRADTLHGYAMDKDDTLDVNARLADAAKLLGAPVIVVHCSAFAFKPFTLEGRKKTLLKLLPEFERLAKRTGVCFAFENVLPGVATELAEYAVSVSSPDYFGFCYDSAHDQIDGPRPFDLLKRQADRLKTVHLSDRIRELVDHVTPGEGFVAFDQITNILKTANIAFPLLMEVMMTHSSYKDAENFLSVAYGKASALYDAIHST